jgi:Domain of unknown function (DUF4912)
LEEPPPFSIQSRTGGTDIQKDDSALRPNPSAHFPLEALQTLPVRYNVNQFQLMVQSPFKVFAYWEITSDQLQKVLAPYPKEEQSSFRMILRWIEVGQDIYQAFDSGAVSEWWFTTRPGRRYQAELCLHSEDFGAIPVFASNEVETPCDSIAPTELGIEECSETTKLLTSLVELTGLKRELKQPAPPMQITEGDVHFGDLINSGRRKKATQKELRWSTPRPTSFFW